MSTFESTACWDMKIVDKTVFSDVGAISTDNDALFLATHVSLPITMVKPTGLPVDEHAVLALLHSSIEQSDNKNLVIAITGPSGSGKSHLVRWLRASLEEDDSRIEVVYVPRRVTSLREVTDLLLRQLGGTVADELRLELDKAVDSYEPPALAEALLNQLWQMLKFQPPLTGTRFTEVLLPLLNSDKPSEGRGGLAFLVGEKGREHMLREDGVLRRLAESALGRRGGGDEDKPAFTADEVNFTRVQGVRTGLPDHAKSALSALSREGTREAAAELLNANRDAAIQHVLGMQRGRGLREVFAEARRRLVGKSLVLMFEDLALMEFIEGAVLDEFANHGDEQTAPLRVVFAVTDDKYAALEETIEGRVSNRFSVGAIPVREGGLDEGPGGHAYFIAKYLNAARVGRDRLVAAMSNGRAFPNACQDCPLNAKDECHAAFGSVDTDLGKVGLYPLNASALRHGIGRQFAERRRQNRPLTARFLIEQLVEQLLRESQSALKARAMPSEGVAVLLDDGSGLLLPRELVPEPGLEEGSDTFLRVVRARQIWFDEQLESPEVARAFALPGRMGVAPVLPPSKPGGSEAEENEKRKELPEYVARIQRWGQGGDMDPQTSTDIRRRLRSLVESRLDLGKYLMHASDPIVESLLKSVIGDGSFDISGAPGAPSESQLRFTISEDNEGARLLQAAAWYSEHRHWIFDDPKRRWDLPINSERDDLAAELESFLDACVADVEASVVSSLFIDGIDPVEVAVQLLLLSNQALGVGGVPPKSWASAASAARHAVESDVAGQLIKALAAARQSDRAEPAAIDTARTRERTFQATPDSTIDLRRTFPELHMHWNSVFDACQASAPRLAADLAQAMEVTKRLVGEDSLAAVGSAIYDCVARANDEGVLEGELSIAQDWARGIRESSLDPSGWSDAEIGALGTSPTLEDVLARLPGSAEVVRVGDALASLDDVLKRTRGRIDARMETIGGAVSLDDIRREFREARDRVIGASRGATVGRRQ